MCDPEITCDRCGTVCKKVHCNIRGAEERFYPHLCSNCKRIVDRELDQETRLKREAHRRAVKEPLKKLNEDLEDLGAV